MIRYTRGNISFLSGFALLSPWLIGMKAGMISNSDAKQKVLRHFFGGIPPEKFRDICESFTREKIPALIRPAAIEKIREYQRNGTTIVVVSASPGNFVYPWCRENQLDCIATRLEIKDKVITGRIEGKNCYGEEKVRRIREKYDLSSFSEIHAYGDSGGDKPMLALATSAYFKPFRDH
jgi:HAD superfamily hydrolase (TIGR01490 family)